MGEMECAFVIINGLKILRCALPKSSEGSCSVMEDVNPDDDFQISDYKGCFEIHCLFYSTLQSDTPHIGFVTIDEEPEKEKYIGVVPKQATPRIVGWFVKSPPRSIRLTIKYDDRPNLPHPDEAELIEEIRALLNDPTAFNKGGSASLAAIQNRVKGMHAFHSVVGQHYRGDMVKFVKNHPEVFVTHSPKTGDTRIALRENELTYLGVDSVADKLRKEREAKVVAVLKGLLAQGEMDYRTVLRHLEKVKEFTDMLCASQTMLRRFLEAHKELFWVVDDPLHTVLVGLVNDPPAAASAAPAPAASATDANNT